MIFQYYIILSNFIIIPLIIIIYYLYNIFCYRPIPTFKIHSKLTEKLKTFLKLKYGKRDGTREGFKSTCTLKKKFKYALIPILRR